MNLRSQYLILALIIVCGLFLRMYRLDSRGVWIDEKMSLACIYGIRSHGPESFEIDDKKVFTSENYDKFFTVDNVVKSTVKDNGNGLFHNLMLHFWVKIFGPGDFSIRFFSVLLSLGAVVIAFFAFRIPFGKDLHGLIAAGLASIHPLIIEHAQSARMYSMAMLCTMAATYFFFRIIYSREKSLVQGLMLGLFMALAFLSHYFTVFLLGAQGITFIICKRNAAQWISVAAGAGMFILVAGLWMLNGGYEGLTMMGAQNEAISATAGVDQKNLPDPVSLGAIIMGNVKIVVRWLGLGLRNSVLVGLAVLLAAALLFAGIKKVWKDQGVQHLMIAMLLHLAAVSLVSLMSGHTTSFLLRYATYLAPFVCGLMAITVGEAWEMKGVRMKLAIGSLVGVVLLMGATLAMRSYHDTADGKVITEDRVPNPYLTLREEIVTEYQAGDTIFYQSFADAVVENFYLRDREDIVQVYDSTLKKDVVLLTRPNGDFKVLKYMTDLRY